MSVLLAKCCRFCQNCTIQSGTRIFCKIHSVNIPVFSICEKFSLYNKKWRSNEFFSKSYNNCFNFKKLELSDKEENVSYFKEETI